MGETDVPSRKPITGKKVLLSVMHDESSNERDVNKLGDINQTAEALGYQWADLRWGDDLQGENVNIPGTNDQLWMSETVLPSIRAAGLETAVLASGSGKHRFHQDNGKPGAYMTENQAIEALKTVSANAKIAGTPFIRLFSGYHHVSGPSNEDFTMGVRFLARAIEEVLEPADQYGLLEPEVGLTMYDADTMIKGVKQLGQTSRVMFLPDLANLHLVGKNAVDEAKKLFESGVARVGGWHWKAYGIPVVRPIKPGEEELMTNHVPVGHDGRGTNYNNWVQFMADHLEEMNGYIASIGGYGVPTTVEGHIRGAGWNRGWSKRRGLYLATWGVLRTLEENGVGHTNTTVESFRQDERMDPLELGMTY